MADMQEWMNQLANMQALSMTLNPKAVQETMREAATTQAQVQFPHRYLFGNSEDATQLQRAAMDLGGQLSDELSNPPQPNAGDAFIAALNASLAKSGANMQFAEKNKPISAIDQARLFIRNQIVPELMNNQFAPPEVLAANPTTNQTLEDALGIGFSIPTEPVEPGSYMDMIRKQRGF